VKSETKEEYKIHLNDTMKLIAKKSKRLIIHDEKITDILNYYDKYKDIMQRNMQKKDDILFEEDFIDHHKIAAAMCCSVVKAEPIEVIMKKSGKKLKFIEKCANEMCGYLIGLEVIQKFLNKKISENISIKKKKNNPVMTPKPTVNNNTYTDWFAKLLKEKAFEHLDYESDKFEVTMLFFISHIYFLIEKYTFIFYNL